MDERSQVKTTKEVFALLDAAAAPCFRRREDFLRAVNRFVRDARRIITPGHKQEFIEWMFNRCYWDKLLEPQTVAESLFQDRRKQSRCQDSPATPKGSR